MTHSSTPQPASSAPQSYRTWSHAQSLAESLGRAEAGVRAKPRDPSARWLLVELLCVLGHWERALRQLQAWAGLGADNDSTAQVVRGLIGAEARRAEVFAGRIEPATVAASTAPAPLWMTELGRALKDAALPDRAGLESADLRRESAFQQTRDTGGTSNVVPRFTWLADSDTRLGPVCEVVLAGAYRWLAFEDLVSMSKAAPRHLLDLVWRPVDLVLRDRTPLKCYMPMRYPVRPGDADALLMGRETLWKEVGRSGVHGRGQKVWSTDAGDMALLDLRECRLQTAAPDDTPGGAQDVAA